VLLFGATREQDDRGEVALAQNLANGMQVAGQAGAGQRIVAVATGITAFVGRALRGPLNRPVAVSSFAEYQAVFGGLWQPSMLSYAVEQYFDNGGESAIVVRVINGGRAPTLTMPGDGRPLKLVALSPGTREFLRAAVDYDGIPTGDADSFNLTVQRLRAAGSEHVEDQEIFRRVSVSPDSPRFLEVVLQESALVRVHGRTPTERPRATPLGDGYVASSPDGHDGAQLTDYDLIGSATERTGLFALADVESFNFLCLPPLAREQPVGPSALMVAGRYCRHRSALLLLDPPAEWTDVDRAIAGVRDLPVRGEDAVMYFPQLLAYDRLKGRFERFAPSAAAAGMLARLDRQDPAWGPHHDHEAALRPGLRPLVQLDEAARARLAIAGINVLQAVRPKVMHGARTLAGLQGSDHDWCYLATKRFALMLANSIERGTRWCLFHRGSTMLWTRLERQVAEFLADLEAEGRLPPAADGASWFVVCDERLNAPGAPGANLVFAFRGRRAGRYHAFMVSHTPVGSSVRPATLNRLFPLGRPDSVPTLEFETTMPDGLLKA
jgi:uncharacterized protein